MIKRHALGINIRTSAIALILFFCINPDVQSQMFKKYFTDSTDNAFEMGAGVCKLYTVYNIQHTI
jgi:hypothetical protein